MTNHDGDMASCSRAPPVRAARAAWHAAAARACCVYIQHFSSVCSAGACVRYLCRGPGAPVLVARLRCAIDGSFRRGPGGGPCYSALGLGCSTAIAGGCCSVSRLAAHTSVLGPSSQHCIAGTA